MSVGSYPAFSPLPTSFLENGSLGMQCDKIEKFVKGTDSKSANLPQIFQSLHSHTANTNFFACSSKDSESILSQRASLDKIY